MAYAIVDKIIELIVGLAMITYGLFNAGGIMNAFAGIPTGNFSTIGWIFTSIGPLIVGFVVLLYVLTPFLKKR